MAVIYNRKTHAEGGNNLLLCDKSKYKNYGSLQ